MTYIDSKGVSYRIVISERGILVDYSRYALWNPIENDQIVWPDDPEDEELLSREMKDVCERLVRLSLFE